MKILQIYDGDGYVCPVGSVSSVVYYLSKELSNMGHEVTIFERMLKNYKNTRELSNVTIIRSKCKKISSLPYIEVQKPIIGPCKLALDRGLLAQSLSRMVDLNEYDIVHVHFPFVANILCIFNRDVQSKMVYTAHVGEENKRFGLDSKLKSILSPDVFLMRRVARNVVLNYPLKYRLLSLGIKNIEVIPNGVNLTEFNCCKGVSKIKKNYALDDNIVIMFAGTITPRKGILFLIKAAKSIVEAGIKNFKLLLVGNYNIDKSFKAKLDELILKYKLSELVLFTGFVSRDELVKLYKACDIFVLPSIEEGFGMVVTEALAAGKPIVGTSVGGIPSQVIDSWNGFLVPPLDYKSLADRLIILIKHSNLRHKMSRNSLKFAKKFGWESICKKYLNVYTKLIK